MAEQPIQSSEIIDPNLFDAAIKKANEFLAIEKELENQSKANLAVYKERLSTLKVSGSSGLKEQAQLTKQATDELKNLEVLKQQAAKTEIALANVRAANDRALKAEITTAQAKAKADKQQVENSTILTSKYDALRRRYNDLSRAQIELSIRGRETGTVFKAIKQEAELLRASLDKAEQGAGRFQRNVGNYQSSFNSLGNSVNQLSRELPAFAVSANTGFLAISNNIPALFDALEKINRENALLTKEGKPAVSALKQLGSAIFSVGTVLSVGITLLTLYGAALVKTVSNLFKSAEAYDLNVEAMKEYQGELERTKNAQDDLDKSIFTLQKSLIKNQKLVTDAGAAQLDAIDKLGDKYSENEQQRIKNVGKIVAAQLQAGNKEVEIVTRVNGNIIEIENKKNGEIIRLDREAKIVQTQYSAFYNKQIQTLNEKAIQDKLDILNKETKIFNQKLDDEYTLELENVNATNGAKSKLRQKYSDEDFIQRRSVLDKIRQLEIEDNPDEQGRREEQILFNRDLALREIEDANKVELAKKQIAQRNYTNERALIFANVKDVQQQNEDLLKLKDDYIKEVKKIEAENIPLSEQVELRTRIEIDTNNKILKVKKEYNDKQIELNNEFAKQTQESRKQIAQDNIDYELSLEEKAYAKRLESLSIFNLKEINQLEQQINAKKILQIQADADEQKALTDNETEKLAIQNKADIEIQKEQQKGVEQRAANDEKVLKQALQFEQQILDAFAKAQAEKSAITQKSFDKQIAESEKNIETQRRLAEKGEKNTLAEEEANKVRLERQKEEEKQQEIKRQKVLAFFKLFSAYAEKDPDTALNKALRDTFLAEAVAGAFFKGTEKVEDDLNGAKRHNGRDGYRIDVDGSERILTGDQNKKVGDLSNEALADLAYRHNNGLLDTIKYTAIPTDNFAKNVENNLNLQPVIQELKQVKEAIQNQPVHQWDFNKWDEIVKKEIKNGYIKSTTFRSKRSRIG